MNQERRRQYFIDKPFQAKFILKFCLVTIVSSLLIGGLVYFFTMNSTTVTIENTKVIVKSTADFILPALTLTVVIVVCCSALAVLLLTLFYSHRIAGPAYRLRKDVDRIAKGELENLFQIRQGDQLSSLAEALVAMTRTIKLKVLAIKDLNRDVQELLSEDPLGHEHLKKIREATKMIDEETRFFKVK
jgi:methyl-accepting chemotaxis protein